MKVDPKSSLRPFLHRALQLCNYPKFFRVLVCPLLAEMLNHTDTKIKLLLLHL